MNKNLLAFFLLLFLTRLEIKAQEGQPCPIPPPPGANDCQSSCVYCDFDGYMGNNQGSPSGGNTVCGAITLHNDHWFGFIPQTTTVSIDLIQSNCMNGDGLQMAFWDDCSDDDAVICNPGCAGCGNQVLNLTYTDFTPGQTYWFMVDGYVADVCDFTIDVVQGSILPPAPDQANTPVGPTHVCPGATAVYTIPEADGAGYYHWTAPAGSHINGGGSVANVNAPEGAQVTITFGNSGGNVCVQTGNSCNPLTPQACLPVINMPIPNTVKPKLVICNEDAPFTWDEDPYPLLNAPGTYNLSSTPYDSYLGCDSIVKQTVVIKPALMHDDGTKYICAGSCYHFAGDPYCDPGSQSVVLETQQGCDSLITFNIAVLNPVANIAGNAPITCATMGGLNLNATGYAAGSTFQWSNSNWNFLTSQPTLNVTTTGVYHLIVSVQGGGVVCRDTAMVTVTGNTTPPGASATNTNINCISTTAQLTGSSPTNGVNFHWAGPGITPANQNQQNPTVNTSGTYTLTVTNPANSCTSSASVTVIADNTAPAAMATGGDITCLQSTVTIDGSTDIGSPTWNWSGPGITPANQTLEDPPVTVDGTYSVTVTNPVNGCTNTATAVVNLNNSLPGASAGSDDTLTCLQPNITLQGAGNTNMAPMGVNWTGPGGFSAAILNPSVSVNGQYILTITNQQNGCVKKDTVLIGLDQANPTATAGADSTITCAETSVTLMGQGSSSGSNFVALWAGPGITPANQNQYNPVVGTAGNYTLTITNTANGCTSTDGVTVNIDIAQPTADAGVDQTLTCTMPGVTLSGNGSPAGVTFHWSGPGIGANNVSQQSPSVTLPGNYTLVVTNPVNGCTSSDQAVIDQDANVPMANGGADLVLNCTVNMVNIDGSGSSTGPDITYSWSGPGITGANATVQSPSGITMPGTYNLTVTNTTNTCTNTDIVVITLDNQLPTANAGADMVLNCFNNAIDTLNAGGSSSGAIYTYTWSGPGITPANMNLKKPVINNQPGVYTLVVTNTNNTCTQTDQVTVTSDLTPPTADAGASPTIDCVVTATAIGGASSSGPNFTYNWTGPGITPANHTQAMPTVNMPGNYTLVVTDSGNGCTSSSSVVVNTNAVYPTALAGPDGLLTCAVQNFALNGNSSSSGAGFNILWTGPGITPANQSQLNPQVTTPGTYILSITNTSNSCVSRDTAVVNQNVAVPAASAGAAMNLDCQTTTVTLNGSMSASGANITYLWTGPGITPANQNQKSPMVTMMGAYSILVTDTTNGCSASSNVQVTQDIATPTASAGADLQLTCATPSATINGSGSSAGALFTYVWQGPGINTNNFSLQSPMVSDSGTYIVTVTNTQNHCTATDVVFVDMNKQAPITEAGPDQLLTCAITTVQLDGSQSQVGPNFSYMWSGPGILPGQNTSATPTVNLIGTYNLTVTDASNGCTATDFAVVDHDIISPSADAGSDLVITCANSAQGVIIDASGSSNGAGYTYMWTGPGITMANETQQSPTVLVPGAYTLVVTNTSNGCTDSDNMTVGQDQNLPTANAGQDQTLNCNIQSVILDASGSTSPGGTLEYTWSGPGINSGNMNSEMAEVSQSGTYTLNVLNSVTGCQASDQVIVNLDVMPPAVTTNAELITCQDPNAMISVTSSAANSTYTWTGLSVNSTNEHLASFDVTDPGVYSVTVTAPNGCTSVANQTVQQDANVPEGTVEGVTLNCFNHGMGTIQGEILSPAGSTFTWTGPGIGTQTTSSVMVSQPGFYNFNMTTSTGCKKTLTVQVVQNMTPPTVTGEATDQLDCSTTQVTVTGAGSSSGPSYAYTWTTTEGHIISGANTLNALVDMAGQYQLFIMNNLNGCADSVQVPVTLDPAVPTAFNLSVRDIVCYGDTDGSIAVNGITGGTPPFNYTLVSNNGTTNNQFTGLSAGDYTLMMVDGNGCHLDTVISIGEPGQLVVDLGPQIEVDLGDMATVSVEIQHTTPLRSVTWNYIPPEAICNDTMTGPSYCASFTYLPLNSYRHTVTVIDSNGCVASDAVLLEVNKPRGIYVPNVFNPASSDPDNYHLQIYMGRDVAKVHKWLVFDRWGNEVHAAQNILPGDFTHAWDGKVNGQDGQVAVYVWYALVEFIDGEIIEYKGDVTLLR